MTVEDALKVLLARGHRTVRAQTVADVMWPNARHNNSNGQVFNLSSGVAGRMLRRCRAAYEVRNREWEIIPEFLADARQLLDNGQNER